MIKEVDVSKLSEYEISILVIERDTAQFKASRIDELLNEYGRAKGFVDAEKKETATEHRKPAASVDETTFNILKFEKQTGSRIGEYEVAYKAHNIPEKWVPAYGILSKNNATIASRYHGEGYLYSYWLYGTDKIYRQKRKQA